MNLELLRPDTREARAGFFVTELIGLCVFTHGGGRWSPLPSGADLEWRNGQDDEQGRLHDRGCRMPCSDGLFLLTGINLNTTEKKSSKR